jgi:protein SCO1/2
MPAMTMDFEVKNTNELTGLLPGDSVSFRMVVMEDQGWIEQIKKTGQAAPPVTATPAVPGQPETFRRVREVDPLNVGDLIPDYKFTNETGQAVNLSDFRGKAVAFTFIFTRCPFPNFCPRMSSNFEEAMKKLKAMPNGPKNWHLLSITIDPTFDTPNILKGYARRFGYDPLHWSYLTGELIDITAIAEQFGLQFWRQDGTINHNLRTVVLDTEGRVQKVFNANEWKVDELVAELVKAAQMKKQ